MIWHCQPTSDSGNMGGQRMHGWPYGASLQRHPLRATRYRRRGLPSEFTWPKRFLWPGLRPCFQSTISISPWAGSLSSIFSLSWINEHMIHLDGLKRAFDAPKHQVWLVGDELGFCRAAAQIDCLQPRAQGSQDSLQRPLRGPP